MAYSPKHNYRYKDSLNPGDPDKIIYGADLSDDFEAIATELSLLSQIDIDGDGNINIPPELIEGLGDILDTKADQVDLDAEIAARIAGDADLQTQIDGLGGGSGGGASTWDELTGKPTEFPPEAHTHEQSEVDGLEDRLESIEDSITSGGGFVDAPDDGKLYGRQSEAWAEVVIPSTAWDDITSKPTEFPPADHTHVIAEVTDLQDALDDKADADHTHEIADVNGLQDALDNAGGDAPTYTLPVALRSGDAQLPLTLDGAKLAVMTRGGELELPLAA
jgi:protein involved in polysaccharide export with SLBB domain